MVDRGRALVRSVAQLPVVMRARTAYGRYYATGAHRASGSAAYFGLLTLLPFLGLFYLLLAQLAHADPYFLRSSRRALQSSLGLSPQLVAALYGAEGTASLRAVLTLLGVIGLVYAGVNWMEALEQGLRSVWTHATHGPWWRRYVRRWLMLLVALPSVLLTVVVAVFVGRSPYRLLIDQGQRISRPEQYLLEVLALLVAVSLGALVCYVAYRRIGGAPASPSLRQAALLAGAAIAGLASVGAFALPVVLSNPYGIVVAILAIILWISASVRAMLAMAVWASTFELSASCGVRSP
jgi:membrane protein